ncbi:MAG: DUF3078 domain-containing protein [Alistipes sp.]|nr:DUF3078 domain-containing protein [Alistipes sp.]
MRKFYSIFALILLSLATPAVAQVSIEAAAPAKTATEGITFEDKVKQNEVVNEFSNEARLRAERAAIRKERNTIEFNASLNGSLSNFNAKWQTVNGNANAITGVANLLFTHSYTKGKFTINNKATAKLGYTSKESEWTKSQDEWFFQTSPAYKISNEWNFGAIASFRSQFANGFNGDKKHSSSALAPGYLNVSLGFTYNCPKKSFPIKINLSPISMSATYVTNELIRNTFYTAKFGTKAEADLTPSERNTAYCYGLTLENGNARYEGGSSLQVNFDRTFGKKGVFRYRTVLYSFYGWINELTQQASSNRELFEHLAPTVRWEHTVDIKATKYFSTQFYFQMFYNKAQLNSIQTQILLGVGLSYNFKNK